MTPVQTVPPKPTPNPYRNRVTMMSLALNAAFFFFFCVFLVKVFRIGPAGIEYVRPTDFTAWILLPIFGLSALLLGLNTLYQLNIRKTGEVYFLPVFVVNVIQFIVSIALIVFIVNVLGCFTPNVFGFTVC